MKKILIIPVLTFAIVLTGCGNQAVDNSTKDDSGKDVVVENGSESTEGGEKKDVVVDKKVEDISTSSAQGEDDKDAEEKEEIKTTFSDSIKLTSIKENETLVSPALIEGEADIESGVVIVELRKIDHSLTSDSVEARVIDGKFKISKFWFEFRNTDEGFVAVYDKESKENLVEIPVKFQTVK